MSYWMQQRAAFENIGPHSRNHWSFHISHLDGLLKPASSVLRHYTIHAILLVFSLLSNGCPLDNETATQPGVVALVDDIAITGADLRNRFIAGPMDLRERSHQKGGRHFLLERTIDDALLVAEARRRGLRPSFTDAFEYHRRLMNRFLEREFNPTVGEDLVTEESLREMYDRRIEGFREREQTRDIKVVYRQDQREAEGLVSDLQKIFQEDGLIKLRDHLREKQQPRPGAPPDLDLGPLALGQAASYLSQEVEQAAFSLAPPEQIIFPEPVRYHDGWGVVIVLGAHQAPPPPTFEEERPHMVRAVLQELREDRLDAFVDTFRDEHRVTINTKNIALIPWLPAENDDD